MDTGVHLIDLLLWLVGEAEVARCFRLPEGAALEQEAKLECHLRSDAPAVLLVSDLRALPNLFRVEGQEGFIEFDTFDFPMLKVFYQGSALCRASGAIAFRWPSGSAHQCQLEAFVQGVNGREPTSLNRGDEALRSIELIADAYAKAGCSPT